MADIITQGNRSILAISEASVASRVNRFFYYYKKNPDLPALDLDKDLKAILTHIEIVKGLLDNSGIVHINMNRNVMYKYTMPELDDSLSAIFRMFYVSDTLLSYTYRAYNQGLLLTDTMRQYRYIALSPIDRLQKRINTHK